MLRNLPARLPQSLCCAVFGAACLAIALTFYASMLPDCGGATRCARKLGWNPQEYGASFSKQWLLNGTFWRPATVFRYALAPADFARLKQALQAQGWTFRSDFDGVMGSVTSYYYAPPRDHELEACWFESKVLTYNHTDHYLYVEFQYGS